MARTHIRGLGLILLGLFLVGSAIGHGQGPGKSRSGTSAATINRTDVPFSVRSITDRRASATDGLISRWTGDGNAVDSVGGNNGTLENGAAYTAGVFGQAFRFDGVDDLMQAPAAGLPTGNGDRTLAMWVKIDDSVAAESFFGGYGNFGEATHSYALGASGDKSAAFFSQWGVDLPGPNLDNARWYHIAVTTAAGKTTLYVDGNAWFAAFLTIDTTADSQFFLGRIADELGSTRRLKGAIDDVRVYDRALDGSEILALINERPASGCSLHGTGLVDGGFEQTTNLGRNAAWSSYSTQFGTSLCTVEICSDDTGTAVPRTGNAWLWFDGTEEGSISETGTASQSLIIPATGSASLVYYLRVGAVTDPSTSTLVVSVDGNALETVNEPAVADDDYYARSIDISAYADGHMHLITFAYFRPTGTAGSDNFSIDDVSVIDGCPSASTPRYFDYDGDGKTDVSVFRPSDNVWYLNRSQGGFAAYQFGAAGDVLTPADFTGDGKTDVAVFRPSGGTWYVLRSEDATFYGAAFGTIGDIPAPDDFDADGKADTAVFRPSTGEWFIQGSTAGFSAVSFGSSDDLPTVGDFDGDGKADVAVFRPSNGVWYRLNSLDGSFFASQFGNGGDKVVQADYNGDGKTDLAVWRPSDGTWYIMRSGDNSFYGVQFGAAGDLPTPGDYDGDGRADTVVFRPGNGTWYEQRSTSGFTAVQFGTSGDRPTPNAFVY